MGESYHEGLTGDEIQTFFKNNVLNKKSRHLRAEAINEVYQWYFEK